VLLLR